MISESAQNSIGIIKDILNERNKIVESYKRKLIDAKTIWGKEKTETEKNMVDKLTWIKSVKQFKN